MSRSRPLRLVQIAPYPILPTSAGGKVRIVQLARALCRLGVEVTIVAPYHVTQRRELAEQEPFTLHEVAYPPFLLTYLLIDRPFPYGALVSFHPGYRALLPVRLESFDVCQLEHPAFVDLVSDVPDSVPIVYDSQNVEFDYVSAECPPGLVRRIAGARVRALEARLVKRAAHVLACTKPDARRFSELYGVSPDRVTLVPNGVDLATVDVERAIRKGTPPKVPARLARRAVFTGSDVKHNRAAVHAILTRVAPQFEGEIEFVIVGGCARAFRGHDGSNVLLDSYGDLASYARPGVVGLNPVVAGSGSSLKVLQYLAYDLPVLSTPFGMRGFEELASCVVVAPLDDFAGALRRELPAPRGVRELLERYEWSAVAKKALGVYESLVHRAEPARSL